MTETLQEKRRELYGIARVSFAQPKVAKRYAEIMIAQIDSRRLEFPFIDQLPRVEKLCAHRLDGGLWIDHSAGHIAQALGLHGNDDRGGFEALTEDGRLLELYPTALVAGGPQGASE